MPKMLWRDFAKDARGDFLRYKWVFDEAAIGKGAVDRFKKSAIFRGAVVKMVTDRDDDLPGKETALLNTSCEKTRFVGAKIDDGCDRRLGHKRGNDNRR